MVLEFCCASQSSSLYRSDHLMLQNVFENKTRWLFSLLHWPSSRKIRVSFWLFYSALCIQHFAFFPMSNQIFQFIFWSVEELKLLLVFPHSRESTFSGSNLSMKRTVWIYFAELRDPTVETHLLTLSDFRIKFPENFYLWNDIFY